MPVPTHRPQPAPPERIISKQLQGLVDSCLEEGHYRSALQTLDHIRTPKYRPSPAHLQQLLYLALYPPSPSPTATHKRDTPSKPFLSLGSPSKTRPSIPLPTQEDSLTALDLLHKYRLTNSAQACAEGLPVLYERRSRLSRDGWEEEEEDEEESEGRVAREARRWVGGGKSVWELVRPGAVRPLGVDGARGQGDGEDWEREADEGEVGEGKAAVADHTLGVVEWMVDLWEGEAVTHPDGYSPLLLAQLPPPPAPNMPIMDVNAPLNLVAYLMRPLPPTMTTGEAWSPSAAAETSRRARLAGRLLSLLVHATLPHPSPLSPSNLLRQTSYLLPTLSPSSFQTLLTSLHPLPPLFPTHKASFARFNLALCALFLAHTSKGASSQGLVGASPSKKSSVPAPRRARALGRAPPAGGKEPSVAPSETPTISSTATSSLAQDGKGEKTYPLAAPQTLLPMFALEPRPPVSSSSGSSKLSSRARTPPFATAASGSGSEEQHERHRLAKLGMLRSLVQLEVQKSGSGSGWEEAVKEGEVRGAVERWKMDEGTWVVVRRMLEELEGGGE